MAGLDFNQQISRGVDTLRAEQDGTSAAGCRAGDLKGLLNAIVDQISEADRRHSDTLQQLQDRLSTLGRDAKAIKPRVPDSYAAAFERIEAGMSELATRIAEAADGRSAPVVTSNPAFDDAPVSMRAQPYAPAAATPAPATSYGEPPAALRSASEPAAPRRREDAPRGHADIDTFDVIETSLPGNVSDPWDRDAAEALTGHYESGASGYASKVAAHEVPPAPAPFMAMSQATAPSASLDTAWLEARFADISKRIDESLNDIRPDQGFFALGQRVERFEQHINAVIENVATRNDVEGIRLIEAHVSELAGHLENAHQQLLRLDVIESSLNGIASKLDDVHHAATVAANDPAPLMTAPAIDVDLVARKAAEAAAQQFAKLQPTQPPHDPSEVRDLLRSFIVEARQGEENTSALLDTLQQAMIRLLDRVDQMELNALQSAHAQAQSAPHEYVREQVRFGVEPGRGPAHHEPEPTAALDAAVAAVASAKTMASPFTPQAAAASEMGYAPKQAPAPSAAPRSPDKMRQDFIAEARRAKMRLNAEGEADGAVAIARPDAGPSLEVPRAAPPTGAAARQPAKAPATKAAPKASADTGLAPRLRVLGLAGVLAAAGAYGAMTYLKAPNAPAPIALDAAAPQPNTVAAGDAAKLPDAPAAPAAAKGEGSLEPTNTIPPGTRGEIVTDEITVGTTSVPLYGIAVDSERPMTAADLARAARQQAMANVSGQLGQAAVDNPAAVAMPTALQPSPSGQLSNVPTGSMSQSSALDLPPASVGPLSLRLAAANGDPSAEFEVGARLAEGKGTDQNFKEAAKWYQRSASRGFAQAQYRLGTLYERGLGLKADAARATDWYQRAAEQGNVKAMHNLAVLSANQSNGGPDYVSAATWFEKAAELGLSDSQFNLAVLNENGLGVTQDLPNAYKWLSLAAKSGDKEAIRRLEILKGKLTQDQLAKADALLATWRAKTPDAQVNDPRKAGEAWKRNPANGVTG